MNFHLLRVHRVDEVRHDSWPLGLPFISSFVVDWGSLPQKRQRFQISEVSPLKDDTVEPGQDYMTSMKLGPNVAQNTVGNLSFYVIFCEGFMDFFPAHPIASHRIPSRRCSRHLQFFEIFGSGTSPE